MTSSPILRRFAVMLMAFSLTACATANCPRISPHGRYCLQPTTEVAAFEVQQKVESHYRDKRNTMISNLAVHREGLDFVGLTPMGQTLIHISYDNHAASAHSLLGQPINPALFVAMLQLSLWPADAVRKGLDPHLNIHETPHDRQINAGNKPILLIRYTDPTVPYANLHIEMPGQALALDIESLTDAESLP